MRSTLFIAPAAPTLPSTDDVGNPITVPDASYFVVRTIDARAPTYGGQLLIHGAPGTAMPGNATLVIHDGTVAWSWGDLIADRPLLYRFFLNSQWKEADGVLRFGSVRDRLDRGASVLSIIRDNAEPHMFAGDPP